MTNATRCSLPRLQWLLLLRLSRLPRLLQLLTLQPTPPLPQLPLLLLLLAWLVVCPERLARAAPPALDLASEPLLAGCVSADGGPPVRGMPLVLPGAAAGAGAEAAASAVFQAVYSRVDWSGHFERYAVQASDASTLAAGAPMWDAGAILTGVDGHLPRPTPAARNIYTAIVQPDGTLTTVPFAWDAISSAQRALLDRAPTAGARSRPDGMGPQRLDYLRGERALEGSVFRRRSSVLGDAVNSTAVYVGVASAVERGAAYADFYARSQTRRPAVYIGTNDGMLHGFDASDGSELFAYVPDALFSKLNRLTSPAYVHTAYVDGPASAGEAYTGAAWKTVLVSAMGGGAQGVFALDVTDPLHFAASGVLWEFTDRDDPMMGNVTTLPRVARVRTGGSGAAAVLRDVAVVASGVNNYAADGHASASGNGALFLLALDKLPSQPWRLNDNYYRLVTPISDAARANGLSAPALAVDADGVLRYAYAGDLQGNLWRFDLTGNAPWSGAVGPGPAKTPLFVARDAAGVRQAIAQQPRLVYAAGGGYLILFGTGRMLEAADRLPARAASQSYYAILDTLADPPQLVSGRGELTPRTLSGADDDAALTLLGADLPANSKGWYIDFLHSDTTGERSLDSGVLANGKLLFNTVLPGRMPCDAARSRSYALDVLTGLPSMWMASAMSAGDTRVTARLAPGYAVRPVVLRLPAVAAAGGTGPAIAPSPAVASVTRTVAIAMFSNVGDVAVRPAGAITVAAPSGRLSWREVVNWRELHAAARR
ncbi:pilus assembly protein PilY [Duganella sp. LX20W]|uniref:Pilus assembly protein PilY n=1 Tax=Rugamonas brunnea TaxID=2758569 RepID=A0A7W2IAQ2_9BURK|nr:PilC/PilY family type IV pilus protein [Rugamonas brunnea]MBA5636102.1 pilus assembly protein PilY [Rugamonas brunnea]